MDNSMKEFLQRRNLTDVHADNFCVNSQTSLLKIKENPLLPNGTPFVLFSAYPHNSTSIDVHDGLDEFLKKFYYINIENHNIRFIEGERKIDTNSISYFRRTSNNCIRKYFEFQKNGFIEQGFSDELTYIPPNSSCGPILHHCRITGAFWAFVKFSKLYYERLENIEEFDVILSIRNCIDPRLLTYHGNKKENDFPSKNYTFQKTNLSNIRFPILSLKSNQLTDENIAIKVREASDNLAQKYGMRNSTCYDSNDVFDWYRMDEYTSAM